MLRGFLLILRQTTYYKKSRSFWGAALTGKLKKV
jgi:hypothetical protein